MNKQNLNAKWGKYCDTDKLVTDMMALLTKYRHRNTEHGVCVLLDKYFKNKEPLIKLFATSEHYIGDMRISLEKEFERRISDSEIRGFFNNIYSFLHYDRLLKYQDENGKSLHDYFTTGKLMFDLKNIPNDTEMDAALKNIRNFNYSTKATVGSHKAYDNFHRWMNYFNGISSTNLTRDYSFDNIELKHGTKTSRAFNKVCVHYGVDQFPEYNKTFARYADLVSGLVRKMNFVISLNPLDYLTMSLGVSWRSCHMIDGGMCQGGCLSYMLDKTSMVTYVVDSLEGNIHEIPKLYRQMFHYSEDMFMQNRLYPQANDGATNLYDKFRDIVTEEFSKLLKVENKWKVDCGYSHCKNHINTKGSHYTDYYHNNSCSIFYPDEKKTKISDYVMTVGHKGICPHCGKEMTVSGAISHCSCVATSEEEVFDFD